MRKQLVAMDYTGCRNWRFSPVFYQVKIYGKGLRSLPEEQKMIDEAGMRANVGIILSNTDQRLLWARRVNNPDAWQFPQGGMQEGESPLQAMYRELQEELGLSPEHVQVLAETQQWYSYLLPEQYIRRNSHPLCIGQKQKWFLLRLVSDDAHIHLNKFAKPEFDQWRWVDYWYPLGEIVEFKREVYRLALQELACRLGL